MQLVLSKCTTTCDCEAVTVAVIVIIGSVLCSNRIFADSMSEGSLISTCSKRLNCVHHHQLMYSVRRGDVLAFNSVFDVVVSTASHGEVTYFNGLAVTLAAVLLPRTSVIIPTANPSGSSHVGVK